MPNDDASGYWEPALFASKRQNVGVYMLCRVLLTLGVYGFVYWVLPELWCGIAAGDTETARRCYLNYAHERSEWHRAAVAFPFNPMMAFLGLNLIGAAAVSKPLARALMRLWR